MAERLPDRCGAGSGGQSCGEGVAKHSYHIKGMAVDLRSERRSLEQVREAADPATLVGRGKLDEIRAEATARKAPLIIFDGATLQPCNSFDVRKALTSLLQRISTVTF